MGTLHIFIAQDHEKHSKPCSESSDGFQKNVQQVGGRSTMHSLAIHVFCHIIADFWGETFVPVLHPPFDPCYSHFTPPPYYGTCVVSAHVVAAAGQETESRQRR